LKYPELYRELQKRRHLSLKTFLTWTWKAIYQAGVIMLGAIFLFDRRLVHVVGITFTALILTELLMVAVEVKRWHTVMVASEVLTLLIYGGSIFALSSPRLLGTSTFDLPFMLSTEFLWKVSAITAVSCVPVWVGKIFSQRLSPEKAMKIR
jgi:phospholipid-translocating ATPase